MSGLHLPLVTNAHRGFAWLLATGVVMGLASHLSPWEPLRVSLALFLLVGGAAVVWCPTAGAVDRLEIGLARAFVHLLACLTLVTLWEGGVQSLAWVWATTLGLGLFLRGFVDKGVETSDSSGNAIRIAELVVAALLGMWMLAFPASINLWTDMPAHLGAIRDAVQTDRMWSPDLSFAGAASAPDPRFGLFHGLYAALARWTDTDPTVVIRAVPVVLTPVWMLAHAWWFRLWSVPRAAALTLALLFTIAGSGGRGFGLWTVVYPGNVCIAISALATGLIWKSLAEASDAGWRPSSSWWTGIALMALGARIHPFAWWLTTTVLLQAVVLVLLVPRIRFMATRLAVTGSALLGGGLILLLPVLIERGRSQAGLHQLPLEVVHFGSSFFIADPLGLMHWGGGAALLIAPILFLTGGTWWRESQRVVAASLALAVWTLSLNPFLTPRVWDAVSYLALRTTRLVHSPWWWWTLAAVAASTLVSRSTSWPRRVPAILLLLICAMGLVSDLGTAFRVIGNTPSRHAPIIEPRIRAMRDALVESGTRRFLADPRASYGIRALGGPSPVLYPMAHASPNDLELTKRLADYRRLFGPMMDPEVWANRLRASGASHLLVDLAPESLGHRPEFGYEASASRSLVLANRLRAWTAPVAEGKDWILFSIPASGAPAREAEPTTYEAAVKGRLDLALARGSEFIVTQVSFDSPRAEVGDEISVTLTYEHAPQTEPLTAHPDWEQVYLRFARIEEPVPAWARSIDKLYRKLVVESSPRSQGRFGVGWIPFGGTWPSGNWDRRSVREQRTVRVPAHLKPGLYRVELSVQEATWRARHQWRDYLRDDDRYSGTTVATLDILAATTATGETARTPSKLQEQGR